MPASYGFRGFLGLAKETSWGTPVAATEYFEALSESVVGTIDRFPVKNIFGIMYEPDDEDGLRRFQGDIVLAAHPRNCGHFFKGCLGVNSVTVILSGFLFRNVFTPAVAEVSSLNSLPPYTLEIFRDITSSDQFTGVQFGRIQASCAPNQDLRLTVGTIAKNVTEIAASTSAPTFPTSPVGVFKFDTCLVTLAGVVSQKVEALTFTFDNQLEGIAVLNSTNVIARCQRSNVQTVRISGTMTLDDYTDIRNFRQQSEFAITAQWSKPASFHLIIETPRVVFETYPHQLTGRDRLTIDFSAIGRWLVSSANALRIALTTTNTF